MSRHTIIGTAGHVDHGKTQLIKALSGFDLDSLKEEKARGITIEPGFAYLTLPDGGRCGIIDVPGHEKFIRNMLAGAGSVDLALFVVACDEGMMPQSREHLDILSLLGIKHGIVALTKTDLADAKWIETVSHSIRCEMKGTFLESAPIVPVSARTGAGIENLRQSLFEMISQTAEQESFAPSRLPVDRVFSVEGFGTVVTGTLTQGKINVGDEMLIYPSLTRTKVRNLQVHGQNVTTANKSQRVAVNLSNIKTTDINKGCVLACPNSMHNTQTLDVRLDIVKGTKRKIANNSRLHFYHGTDEMLCRVVLLGGDELAAGQSGYAQLHLESTVSAKSGDRFVVRFFSPLETVGGGIVIDPFPQKRKRNDESVLQMFTVKESGSLSERIACFIADRSWFFPDPSEIKLRIFENHPQFDETLDLLATRGEIFFVKDSVIHKDFLTHLAAICKQILVRFHSQNPLLNGMRKDELRARLLPAAPHSVADIIINLLEKQKKVTFVENMVVDALFKAELNGLQQKLTHEITAAFLQGGFTPPSINEIMQCYPRRQADVKQTMSALLQRNVLVSLTSQVFIHNDFYSKALEIFSQLAAVTSEVTLAQFRDATASSRKYALALLEHFDSQGYTRMEGDARVLLKRK